MRTSAKGPLMIFGCAVCFSLSGVLIKLIPWSPLAINGSRSLLGLLVVGLFLWLSGHKLIVNRYVLLGGLSLSVTSILFTIANKLTAAANVIVIQYTVPIFVILFMWLFFRARPNKLDVTACILVFCGIVFFFIDGLTTGGMLGNVLALLSAVTYSGMYMMNVYPKADPLSSVFWGLAMNVVVGCPFVFAETSFGLSVIGCVLLLGLVQQGLAFILFAKGIERTPPVAACLITSIEPILNPIWVALVCHEMISPVAFPGMVIVLGTVIYYNLRKAKMGADSSTTPPSTA